MKIKKMKSTGFSGFESIQSLINNDCINVPDEKGIYFVLKDIGKVEFLKASIGGHFKGKDPTVSVQLLNDRWVEGPLVIYIGQSGGGSSQATLKRRLKQFMKFGQGLPIGHWGGRLIWQLKDNRKLKICWKSYINDDPRLIEKALIVNFNQVYGKNPFANING